MLKYPIIFFDISYLSGPPPVTALDDAAAEAFANMEIQQQQAPAAKKPPSTSLARELHALSLVDVISLYDGKDAALRGASPIGLSLSGGSGSGSRSVDGGDSGSGSLGWFKRVPPTDAHSGDQGQKQIPRLPHKDAQLSLYGLETAIGRAALNMTDRVLRAIGTTANVIDVDDEFATEHFLNQHKMKIWWKVPSAIANADPTLIGRSVAIDTDVDIPGFLRAFWPQGYAMPAQHAPVLNVECWPRSNNTLLPGIKRGDDLLTKAAAPAPGPAAAAEAGGSGTGGAMKTATDGAGGAAPAIPPPVPPRQPQQQGETVSASTTSSAVSGTGGGAGGIRRVPYPCCSDIIDDVQTYC
ncbi:hypothetical protein OC835_003279 [Tilletia horrida]|nr:hypothetical protein OC835_003279 [Tilletia horrida]